MCSSIVSLWLLSVTITLSLAQDIVLQNSFASAAPCSGLFSLEGFTGCSSKKNNNENVGSIRYFSSVQSFSNAVTGASFVGSWIIPTAVWCTLTRESLEALNPLATSLLVIEESDQPTQCPAAGFDPLFDKFGSGLNLASLSFPVARLGRNDSISLLEQAQSSSLERTRFQFYMGSSDGSVTSDFCLQQQRCSPLGGLSTWGVVNSPPLSYSEQAIMLACNMDSTAFFHDLSFGFHASGGDVAIALAATRALAGAPSTPTRIITAVFQGESFFRIGSRRFVQDILTGTCKTFSSPNNDTCVDPPNFGLEWTKFNGSLTRITGVLALSNVLRTDDLFNETFIHAFESVSNVSDAFGSRLRAEFVKLGWNLPVLRFANASGLPPSALTSFAERKEWNQSNLTGGIVLTGFDNDVSESNPHFQTENDVLNESLLDAYVDRATLISTAIARTLYFISSGGNESSIVADRDLVSSLIQCFGGDFASDCPLANDALNLSTADLDNVIVNSAFSATTPFVSASTNPLPSYTGVYTPLAVLSGRVKIRENFIRNVLANLTLGGVIPGSGTSTNVFACSSDVDCRDSWNAIGNCPGPLASNASVACIGGGCVCSTVSFQEAWSTRLLLNPATGTFNISNDPSYSDDPVWTEPFWQPPLLVTFTAPSTADVVVGLVSGILLTALSALAISFVKSKEASLGKFKLA